MCHFRAAPPCLPCQQLAEASASRCDAPPPPPPPRPNLHAFLHDPTLQGQLLLRQYLQAVQPRAEEGQRVRGSRGGRQDAHPRLPRLHPLCVPNWPAPGGGVPLARRAPAASAAPPQATTSPAQAAATPAQAAAAPAKAATAPAKAITTANALAQIVARPYSVWEVITT